MPKVKRKGRVKKLPGVVVAGQVDRIVDSALREIADESVPPRTKSQVIAAACEEYARRRGKLALKIVEAVAP